MDGRPHRNHCLPHRRRGRHRAGDEPHAPGRRRPRDDRLAQRRAARRGGRPARADRRGRGRLDPLDGVRLARRGPGARGRRPRGRAHRSPRRRRRDRGWRAARAGAALQRGDARGHVAAQHHVGVPRDEARRAASWCGPVADRSSRCRRCRASSPRRCSRRTARRRPGLEMLVRCAAEELGEHRVRVERRAARA